MKFKTIAVKKYVVRLSKGKRCSQATALRMGAAG